ncbi:MAG: hypothetical protein A2Z88_11525 [Omnitrophica WOR_2 bacterium GWA2_47_8]|nr:MAG: hypothetical protein A2Z88_11525 [Omnitrophica WOR_2 bacterium GWA2_47_8]
MKLIHSIELCKAKRNIDYRSVINSAKVNIKNSRTGFTLIELVMTIILLGVVSIPLSLLIVEQINGTFQSENYAQAANFARVEMERIRNLPYASVVTANFPNYLASGYDVARTVTFVAGNAGSAESLKQVSVTVSKGGPALETLITYLARNVGYGI